MLDHAAVEVCVGSSDAHALHVLDAADEVEGGLQGLDASCHVVVDVGIGFCANNTRGVHGSALVHEAEY